MGSIWFKWFRIFRINIFSKKISFIFYTIENSLILFLIVVNYWWMYLIMNIIGRVPSLETWAEIAIRRAALYCSPALKLELPNMNSNVPKWPEWLETPEWKVINSINMRYIKQVLDPVSCWSGSDEPKKCLIQKVVLNNLERFKWCWWQFEDFGGRIHSI